MNIDDKDRRSKIGKFVPMIAFLLFVYVMAAMFVFFPKSDYSSSEKRYLEKFPDTSVDKVLSGEFGSGFETYFADHFPARNLWVGMNAYYDLAMGNNGANGVYKGTDDWLINKPLLTDESLDKNIKAIADFAKSTDVPVTAMFVPSTGYIQSSMLPNFHDKYGDEKRFRKSAVALSKAGVNFVDLLEPFKEASLDGVQLYYKTDHHWTTAGAYKAYTQLCKSLNMKAIDKNSLKVEKYDGFYGTTYSSSGFWLTSPDCVEIWSNPKNSDKNIKVKITEGNDSKSYGTMYFYDHLKEDDKYPVFIDGNHALTEITNTNAKGGTAVVIKDSYSHCLAPFLAENFKKVILVDMRYYKMSVSELVNKEKASQIFVVYGIDNISTDTDLVWLK